MQCDVVNGTCGVCVCVCVCDASVEEIEFKNCKLVF